MSATDRVVTAQTEEQVCFGVEIRVPFSLAEAFRARLTGNDDDIVLAAELGIEQAIGFGIDNEKVELVLGPDKHRLREELRAADQRFSR